MDEEEPSQEFLWLMAGEHVGKSTTKPTTSTGLGICSWIKQHIQLVETTTYFVTKAMSREMTIPVLYHRAPFLELFGDVAIGYMLLWQAEIADRKLRTFMRKPAPTH